MNKQNTNTCQLGSKKEKKKIESKKRRGFFPRIPYNFTPFCFSLRYLYYYVELVSLCAAYTLKRGLEKREKTSAYKSNNNNNNNNKRERKNSFDNTQNR